MKLFYTTEEVAEHFDVNSSRIRYYIKEFRLKIKVQGRKKVFTQADIAKLSKIIDLVDKQSFTIEGAKAQLRRKKEQKNNNEEVISKLESIKKSLESLIYEQ